MKKRGFTLVELLAVIIIIGVVALITVPSVNSILERSRKGAFRSSANGILRSIQTSKVYQDELVIDDYKTYTIDDSKIYHNDEELKNITSGEILGDGIVVVNRIGEIYIKYENDKYCATKNFDETEVKIYDGKCDDIEIKACTKPIIVGTPDNNTWSQIKKIDISYGTIMCEGLYSLDNGDSWNKGNEVIVDVDNTKILVKTDEEKLIDEVIEYTAQKIDRTPPETVDFSFVRHVGSIDVIVNASDLDSGIKMYAFSKDGGKTWTSYGNEKVFTFTDLADGTYQIKVKAYNGTYGTEGAEESLGAKESEIKNVSLITCPEPKIVSISPEGWAQQKTLTIDYGNVASCTGSYSIDDGQTWNSGNSVVIYENNKNIILRNVGELNTVKYTETVTNIDRTPPKIEDFEIASTTSSISIRDVNASDSDSGIKMYAFSKDGGKTWTDYQESNMYLFGKLQPGTYYIDVKVFNGTYGKDGSTEEYGAAIYSKMSNVENDDIFGGVPTPVISFPKPTITSISPEGWAQQKTVTIDYGNVEGCDKSYSIDGGNTWINYNGPVVITTNNTSIVAKNSDSVNKVLSDSETIVNIDRTPPTKVEASNTATTNSIRVVANAIDSETNIAMYSFRINNGTWSNYQTSNIYTFPNLTSGTTYKIDVKAYNGTYGTTGAVESLGAKASTQYSVTTRSCPEPEISVSPAGDVWAASKTVTIKYPTDSECTEKYYTKDNGSAVKVTSSTQSLTFNANGTVVASLGVPNTSIKTQISETISKIDNKKPVASIEVVNGAGTSIATNGYIGTTNNSTIKFKCTTGGSGVTKYTYNSEHTSALYHPMIEVDKVISTTNNPYSYLINPSTLINENGGKVDSGTITHTLTCTNGLNVTSEPVTFITKLKEAPSVTLKSTNKTTSSITVQATSSDVIKYEFKIDNDSWINNGTTTTYSFNNLNEGTTYKIYVRVTNDVGLTDEASVSITTNSPSTNPCSPSTVSSSACVSGTVELYCEDGRTVTNGSCNSGGGGGSSGGSCTGSGTISTFGCACCCAYRDDGSCRPGSQTCTKECVNGQVIQKSHGDCTCND